MSIENTSRSGDYNAKMSSSELEEDLDALYSNDNELQSQIDTNLTAANTTASEVVAARGGQANLDTRLDLYDAIKTEVENARSSSTQGSHSTLDARLEGVDSRITNALAAVQGAAEVVEARDDVLGTTHADLRTAINEGAKDISSLTLQAIDRIVASSASIVDVHRYDTRRDSDKGAWRKRCQGLSWYNETLNTATRGATREFPEIALIVATTTAVTIYDATDPTLPMWMAIGRQGTNTGREVWGSACDAGALSAKNGRIYIGFKTVSSSAGLGIFDFVSDRITRHSSSTLAGGIGDGIANRATLTLYGSVAAIASSQVNDVDAFVHPGAPIDAMSRLPIPTVAVATAAGASVIGNAGTVTTSGHTGNVNRVGFLSDGALLYGYLQGAAFGGRLTRSFSAGFTGDAYTNVSTPAVRSTDFIAVAGTVPIFFGNSGITWLREGATVATGMVAYATRSYQSGWMPGDIRGAWMADSVAEVITGGNLVANGDFATDSDWTKGSGWTISAGEAHKSAGTAASITQSGSVTGVRYAVTVTVTARSAGGLYALIGGAAVGIGGAPVQTTGTFTFYGTATAGGLLGIYADASFVGSIDDVQIYRAIPDRSVKGKDLRIIGSITKSAVNTGTDLVGYSGWSAANYLEQPYNSDLDFGTDDFAIMGWMRKNSITSAHETLLRRQDAAGSGGGAIRLRAAGSTGVFSAWISDDNGSTIDAVSSTSSVCDNAWHLVALVRTSSSIYAYVDGVLVATTAVSNASGSLSNSAATVRMGLNQAGDEAFGGSLALWRVTKYAPTPDQMREIYQTEKALFQENAKCLIGGTSDAYQAVGHDPDTDLTYIGTQDGVSVFRGLRRVEYIDNASSDPLTSDNIKAIAAGRGAVLIGTGAEAVYRAPQINMREQFSEGVTLTGMQTPTLGNSWVDYGSSYQGARFWKDAAGMVHLDGVIKTGTLTSAAFTLPPGYRPAGHLMFSTICSDGTVKVGRLIVENDGDVIPQEGGNTFFSLCGVQFLAER